MSLKGVEGDPLSQQSAGSSSGSLSACSNGLPSRRDVLELLLRRTATVRVEQERQFTVGAPGLVEVRLGTESEHRVGPLAGAAIHNYSS